MPGVKGNLHLVGGLSIREGYVRKEIPYQGKGGGSSLRILLSGRYLLFNLGMEGSSVGFLQAWVACVGSRKGSC